MAGAERGFADVEVRIVPVGKGSGDLRTRTDADGRFRLEAVPAGEYRADVLLPLSTAPVAEQEPWTIRPRETTHKDLWLEPPVPPGRGFLARGTIAYQDGCPVRSFRFWLREPSGREGAFKVSGADGAFEKRLPVPGLYQILGLEADGVSYGDLEEEVLLVGGSAGAVRLENPAEVTLLVRDSRNEIPLPSARAVFKRSRQFASSWTDYPTEADLAGKVLSADTAGRIPLGRGSGYTTVVVGAEGFAWDCVTVFHGEPREVPVSLRQGGSVLLRVPRWRGWLGASLRMVAPGRDPRWPETELPDPGVDGTLLLPGLPEGMTLFRVARDGHGGERGTLASGSVTVEAGSQVELTLESDSGADAGPVSVRGSLLVPATWGRTRTTIRLWGTDGSPQRIQIQRGLSIVPVDGPVSFDFGQVFPGNYVVEVEPCWRTPVVVSPGGSDLRLVMPDPVEVRVRIVERETEGDIGPARLSWVPADISLPFYVQRAARDPDTKEFVLLAAPGRYRLWPSADGYEKADLYSSFDLPGMDPGVSALPLELTGGKERIEILDLTRARGTEPVRVLLSLRPAGIFRLTVREGFDLLDQASLRTEEQGGGSVSRGLEWRGQTALLQGLPPGDYVLDVDLQGHRGRRSQPVRIDAGQTTALEIQLP